MKFLNVGILKVPVYIAAGIQLLSGCSASKEMTFENLSKMQLIVDKKYTHVSRKMTGQKGVSNCEILYPNKNINGYPDYIIFRLSENDKKFSIIVHDSTNMVYNYHTYKDWKINESGELVLKFSEVVNDRVCNGLEMTALRIDISDPGLLKIQMEKDIFALVFLVFPYVETSEFKGYIKQIP